LKVFSNIDTVLPLSSEGHLPDILHQTNMHQWCLCANKIQNKGLAYLVQK